MEVRELYPALGKRIEIRCFYLASEAANIRPAHIISHDQQNVWPLCFGIRGRDDQ
jgi:hypothetical protein